MVTLYQEFTRASDREELSPRPASPPQLPPQSMDLFMLVNIARTLQASGEHQDVIAACDNRRR